MLSRFVTGLAWASCWPSALESARGNNPIPILLGGIGALLPDTLDQWVSIPLHKPDIHIVPPPEAPDPIMVAETLAQLISQSQNNNRMHKIECYPLPIGPDRWTPYTIHFDSSQQQITVMIGGNNPLKASVPVPVGFTTNHIHRLHIHSEPLSLRTEPLPDKRVALNIMPQIQQWTHSLLIALVISVLIAGIWGITTGFIAGGAYALHLLMDQWGFTGSTLFWPFTQRRLPGFQWVKPDQHQFLNLSVLWLAVVLVTGNIIRTTAPTLEGPSLFQILLFGGAMPLAALALCRQKKGDDSP